MDRELTWRFRTTRDPETGTAVTRLTPPGTWGLRPYFYQRVWTAGGALVLGCDAAGPLDLWLLEPRPDRTAGRARRLTSGGGIGVQGAYLSDDDQYLYFTRDGGAHCRLHLETGREDEVYRPPEGWSVYGTWHASRGTRRAAGLLMRTTDRVAGTGWDRFRRQFEARPLQRLIDLDLTSGRAATVLEDRRYLGHPSVRPGDEDTFGYCHEGPHDLVGDRLWLVDRDGGRPRPVRRQAPGEYFTHEFWLADGSALVYVRYGPGVGRREAWASDPTSLDHRLLTPLPPCAHLMARSDGRLLTGDGAGTRGDLSTEEGPVDADPWLYVFDLDAGTTRKVCRHQSTWGVWDGNTQASHPHPSFTPDGRGLLFASDGEGAPALYWAALE